MAVHGSILADRARVLIRPTLANYVPIALTYVLPMFDLKKVAETANQVAQDEYDRILKAGGYGQDEDGGAAGEAAQWKGQEYYDTVYAMRQTLLNLLAVGLFHMLEQQLAELVNDATLEALGASAPPADMERIAEWYDRHAAFKINQSGTWAKVCQLRDLTNTVKHGDGASAERLKKQRPQLFTDPQWKKLQLSKRKLPDRIRAPLAGDDVYVDEQSLEDYGNAVVGLLDDITAHFEQYPKQFPIA